jgi:NAD(P)H-quinone oxidoreductase subunit 5
METVVGYSPDKSQNMGLMGGLTKHVPITKTSFLLGTLSLCGIPPLACFWSKDEILNDSWLYSPIFAIIAWATAGLTAFYMFRIYLLTFEGHLNVHFKNYSGNQNASFYSISLWGKGYSKRITNNFSLLRIKNNESSSFFSKKTYRSHQNVRKKVGERSFINILRFDNKKDFFFPYESDNTMLFPLLILVLFTLFVGSIGLPFRTDLDILTKWLAPSINFLDQKSKDSTIWYEFFKNATLSVSIAYFGIFSASFLYKPIYSSFKNFDLINSFVKLGPKRKHWDKFINLLYDWSNNRAYIDAFYTTSFTGGIRELVQLTHFFDRQIIDGITNGVGVMSFFVGEGIKNVGGGRISSYLFFYFSCVSVFLFIYFPFLNHLF